jgi:hypothetical protein
MPLAQYPENNYGDSDSILKLPHRLTDNLREPTPSRRTGSCNNPSYCPVLRSLPEFSNSIAKIFGVDVFHQIMLQNPYHLLSFVPPSIDKITDSLRRFEMEFHVVRWLASSSIE